MNYMKFEKRVRELVSDHEWQKYLSLLPTFEWSERQNFIYALENGVKLIDILDTPKKILETPREVFRTYMNIKPVTPVITQTQHSFSNIALSNGVLA
jgi:hypothetical protein